MAGGIIELDVLKDIYCSNKHTVFSDVLSINIPPRFTNRICNGCSNARIAQFEKLMRSSFLIHPVYIIANILKGLNSFSSLLIILIYIIRQNKFVTMIWSIFVTTHGWLLTCIRNIYTKEKQFHIFIEFAKK